MESGQPIWKQLITIISETDNEKILQSGHHALAHYLLINSTTSTPNILISQMVDANILECCIKVFLFL